MKKIILALMLLSTFSFALPSYIVGSYTGITYKLDSVLRTYGSFRGTNVGFFSSIGSQSFAAATYEECTLSQAYGGDGQYTCVEGYYLTDTGTCPAPNAIVGGECVNPIPECGFGEERINGTCLPKCDPVASQYRSPSGECQDCMSYSSFSGRSSCACDSQGTTYTPQSTMSTSENFGNYQYTRTNITCDNGLRISVYTNPVNTNPQDYNATLNPDGTITPVDPENPTTPPDNNNTIPTPTPTTNDIVEAIKSNSDVAKQIKSSIDKQGATFESVLSEIKKNGAENVKSNQLLTDVSSSLTQFKNSFNQWVSADQANANNQLQAIQGTTNAVNSASNAITSKLDGVINAINGIGDGNGTSYNIDLNDTNNKLDTLHGDINQTNSILNDIKGLFDINASSYKLSDVLPEDGWFETNKLTLDLNNYSGACYLETFSFNIAGESFQFPPPDLVEKIPFSTLSNLFMAFLFILGLKEFLRS